MARLIWDKEDERSYEFGVDHGVLYSQKSPSEYTDGVVWNGLVSVEESNIGGDVVSYHFDGIKYLDTINPKTYQLRITTISVPLEFLKVVGDHSIIPGFVLTRQGRNLFGLSYRTFVGENKGYKIHIVYHAIARPIKRVYSTRKDSSLVETTVWAIDAVPPPSDSYRPSAHYILDSSTMPIDALKVFDDILYGTEMQPARLPSIEELLGLIQDWDPLFIEPVPVTGLSVLLPGMGDLYKTEPDGLHLAFPKTRLKKTPIDGLYRLE